MRTRFRFLYRAGNRYYWEATQPLPGGDSRTERAFCNVDWFWGLRREGAARKALG